MFDILGDLLSVAALVLSIFITIIAIFLIVALSTPIDPEDTYKYRNF